VITPLIMTIALIEIQNTFLDPIIVKVYVKHVGSYYYHSIHLLKVQEKYIESIEHIDECLCMKFKVMAVYSIDYNNLILTKITEKLLLRYFEKEWKNYGISKRKLKFLKTEGNGYRKIKDIEDSIVKFGSVLPDSIETYSESSFIQGTKKDKRKCTVQ
jgi:hypothetical protein